MRKFAIKNIETGDFWCGHGFGSKPKSYKSHFEAREELLLILRKKAVVCRILELEDEMKEKQVIIIGDKKVTISGNNLEIKIESNQDNSKPSGYWQGETGVDQWRDR